MQKDSVYVASGKPESAVASHEYKAGDLLPCPFCGGDVVLDWAPKDQPFVTCKKSCAFTPWFCIGDEEKAVASWNRRAQ